MKLEIGNMEDFQTNKNAYISTFVQSVESLSPYKLGDVIYYVGEENGVEKLVFGNPYKLESVSIYNEDVILTVRGLDNKLYHTIDRFMSQEELTLLLTDLFDEPVKDYTEQVGTSTEQVVDMVNHPPHYTKGGIETLDFIKAKLTQREWIGYLKGNVLKYVSRCGYKGTEETDLGKMNFYANELGKVIEKGIEDNA